MAIFSIHRENWSIRRFQDYFIEAFGLSIELACQNVTYSFFPLTFVVNHHPTIMKPHFQILCLAIIATILGSACSPQKTKLETTLFDTFNQEDYLEMQLTADWAQIEEGKDDEQKFAAQINWEAPTGSARQMPIQLERRGKTRLNHCSFPPLKLIFDRDSLTNQGIGGNRKLKLVTHCNGDEALVLREYLAYQMYQQLTDKSFRVQLVKVTYLDAMKQAEAETHWAFLLENHHDMAERLDGQLLAAKQSKLQAIDSEQYRTMALFQYMIGNTDWNMKLRHNIKMVQLADQDYPTPIPYDFDYSGLVNAPYANPHPIMPVASVRERYFQWRGKDVESFAGTIEHFVAHKQNLLRPVPIFLTCQKHKKPK